MPTPFGAKDEVPSFRFELLRVVSRGASRRLRRRGMAVQAVSARTATVARRRFVLPSSTRRAAAPISNDLGSPLTIAQSRPDPQSRELATAGPRRRWSSPGAALDVVPEDVG